jgi:hypothetical protein
MKKVKHKPNATTEQLLLLHCTGEVLGSILGLEDSYPDRVHFVVSLTPSRQVPEG